ncbi:MAG: Transcription factor WhiB [Frankiales bacterium]|jgi:WhiB family redox-sensing transcriptional regulator|nr:Transcription factor WhiB [Frankiales bacterium]MCW2680760.1 Transcription factor WhiB [Frankiales bacterium]
MSSPRLVVDRLTQPVWRVDAQCRSKNAVHFFAPSHVESKSDKQVRESAARALCGACKVRAQCLEYALDVQEPHGIWGGLNEAERRRIVRRRLADTGQEG